MLWAEEFSDESEIDRAGAGHLVILAGIADIVQVKSNEAIRNGFKVFAMLQQTLAVFDFGVASVVPVADGPVLFKVVQEFDPGAVERKLEDALAILSSE